MPARGAPAGLRNQAGGDWRVVAATTVAPHKLTPRRKGAGVRPPDCEPRPRRAAELGGHPYLEGRKIFESLLDCQRDLKVSSRRDVARNTRPIPAVLQGDDQRPKLLRECSSIASWGSTKRPLASYVVKHGRFGGPVPVGCIDVVALLEGSGRGVPVVNPLVIVVRCAVADVGARSLGLNEGSPDLSSPGPLRKLPVRPGWRQKAK